MKKGEGSRTAERVAERRAAHQLLDSPLVFEDPLALKIIRPEAAALLRARPHEAEGSRLAPYLRAFFAVRSRVAEDQWLDAARRGVTQIVILGAGFDTFAYRPHEMEPGRVFEVDHPATQATKRARLAQAGIAIPEAVTWVPIDFATMRLESALRDHGFDSTRPALFSWLGVVPYLELPAIRETLHYIGHLARGSTLVFDYGIPASSLSLVGRIVFREMAKRVASIGEPWITFFEPADLASELSAAGFSRIEDLGADELNSRYFSGRKDGLHVGQAGRVAIAVV